MKQDPPIKTKEQKAAEEIDLNEGLSWAGKLFFASAAAYILGGALKHVRLPIKIRGNKEVMQSVIQAIMSSREFQREMEKPGATIERVIDKLQLRNMTKERFRQITGKNWPV